MSRGLLGRLLGSRYTNSLYVRDSRHAANLYSLTSSALNTGTPRHKFQYFVNFHFNQTDAVKDYRRTFLNDFDEKVITALVKTVAMPNININTEVLNQYNHRRLVHTKVEPQPVTLSMHDTVDGKTLRFWEMYYEYYFRDGVAHQKPATRKSDKTGDSLVVSGKTGDDSRIRAGKFNDDVITDTFNQDFGYNMLRVGNNKQLLSHIEIFQVHGGKFSLTTLVNPKISAFNCDTLDYSSSDLMEFRFDIQYEAVVYSNVNEPLTREELDRYNDGDFWEMANIISFRTEVPGRDLAGDPAKLPEVADAAVQVEDGEGSVASRDSQSNTSRVQQGIGAIIDGIPGAIGTYASASVFGGKVSFVPRPLQALRSTGNSIIRQAVGTTRSRFASAVTGGVRKLLGGWPRGG